jgi:hypothetical protein
MNSLKHLRLITQTPAVAQSNLQIKLEGTTIMIDRLLLADRQAPWKNAGPNLDDDGTTGGTDTGGNINV